MRFDTLVEGETIRVVNLATLEFPFDFHVSEIPLSAGGGCAL